MENQERLQRLLLTFREMNKELYQVLNVTLQQLGVTSAQYMVLKALHSKPCIGLSELAEQIYSNNSTASGIIDRLVKADLVKRERPDTDRRAISLTLTPQGEELITMALEMRLDRLKPLLKLPSEDYDTMFRIQRDIIELIQQGGEEA
ncbi:MarR family transcriptional regulator [Paenibacillus sp. CCS19]|uniref:MarR family winged helix-turn-helix transcriptional regulator n=1 Tax=Paenibacillus sp. CCS19 TaxID=3158387 RepID=UPI0025603E67|nr:MarR family transcriptional regulator [Paenibacillus cellulosilyticus]GMK37135.1 MarR family transcriptional regulator [Paenibacillus cellulosilyticus]